MKQALLLIAIIGVSLASCNRTSSINPNSVPLDGKWRMITVTENVSGASSIKPSSIPGDVDINFTSQSSYNGIFNGNTPNNQIKQSSYSTGTNQSLVIPALNMTKVAETSWGNEFVDNIRSSQSYHFETDGRLNIRTASKTLTFRKL